jgi:peptidoglycan hydrolase-like protein with peptidoglycan-binding domain
MWRWVVASSTVALLLWLPAPSFARDAARTGGTQTERGTSPHTAGMLSRGAGYGAERGSTAVRRLQVRLRTLGFTPGPIDGLFGPLTQAAVQRFQRARGLVADGVVGPQTRKPLLARTTGRKSRPSGAGRKSRPSGADRREHAARDRAGPEPPMPAEARSPQTLVPDFGGAPDVAAAPQATGLAPGVAAGLGALATALLLGGVWMLRRRRGNGTPAGYRGEPLRRPGSGVRLGMACAALLAVLALGAAAGALFTKQATSGQPETKDAAGAAAVLEPIGADGARVTGQRRQHRSPGSP